MATFQQNIANIRGEAIYGKDVRESIAQAILQAVDFDYSKVVDTGLIFVVQSIDGSPNDFLLNVVNGE